MHWAGEHIKEIRIYTTGNGASRISSDVQRAVLIKDINVHYHWWMFLFKEESSKDSQDNGLLLTVTSEVCSPVRPSLCDLQKMMLE